jgi:hypothetical protein
MTLMSRDTNMHNYLQLRVLSVDLYMNRLTSTLHSLCVLLYIIRVSTEYINLISTS